MEGTPFTLTTEEGLLIRGDFHAPSTAAAGAVLCVHGFKGFKDWGFWPETAKRLAAAGHAAIRFNFSHSGVGEDLETFSEPQLFETGTYSREVADLQIVLSALAEGRLPGAVGFRARGVGLLAHSRGAVSSLAVAASEERFVSSVALWNPVSSVLWWDEEARARWREKGYWEVVNARTGDLFRIRTALLEDAESSSERLDPVGNAARLTVPLLVVVATEDESVPADSGRRIARAAATPGATLVELPKTGHTFGMTHPPAAPTPAFASALEVTLRHFSMTLGG